MVIILSVSLKGATSFLSWEVKYFEPPEMVLYHQKKCKKYSHMLEYYHWLVLFQECTLELI